MPNDKRRKEDQGMRHYLPWIQWGTTVALIVVSAIVFVAPLPSRIARAEEEIKELKADVSQMKKDISEIRFLQHLQTEAVNAVREEVTELKTDVKEIKDDMKKAHESNGQAARDLKEIKEILTRRSP